jgi:hypothetical protein
VLFAVFTMMSRTNSADKQEDESAETESPQDAQPGAECVTKKTEK